MDDTKSTTAASASALIATKSSSIGTGITQNKLFKVIVAMAPVLIVMYIFNMMRSELRRIQNRLDALAMRQKPQSQPVNEYAEFERYMASNTSQSPHVSPLVSGARHAPSNHAENWAHFPNTPEVPPTPPLPPPLQQAAPMPPLTTQESIVIAGSQLLPQMQPEGSKKALLPRIEEIK